MITGPYFLPRHVFLCETPHFLVFLDLHRDRYCCIPRRLLDPCTLVSQGLLTSDRAGSKPVEATTAEPPTLEVKRSARIPALLASIELVPFLLACRRADHALRKRSLECVVQAIAVRSENGTHARTALPVERATRLAIVFDALRLLYPRPPLCTFDSLALLEFLASHGIYARWMFGVRADPFQAHCWVQLRDLLLNDRIERVARLTPIMSVG